MSHDRLKKSIKTLTLPGNKIEIKVRITRATELTNWLIGTRNTKIRKPYRERVEPDSRNAIPKDKTKRMTHEPRSGSATGFLNQLHKKRLMLVYNGIPVVLILNPRNVILGKCMGLPVSGCC